MLIYSGFVVKEKTAGEALLGAEEGPALLRLVEVAGTPPQPRMRQDCITWLFYCQRVPISVASCCVPLEVDWRLVRGIISK